MNEISLYIIVTIVVIIAFIIGFYIAKLKTDVAKKQWEERAHFSQVQTDELKQTLQQKESELELQRNQLLHSNDIKLQELRTQFENQLLALQNDKQTLATKNTEEVSKNQYLHEKLTEQKAEIEQLQQKFKQEFENLANKIFEEKSQKFVTKNSEQLNTILDPFTKAMREFKEKVDVTHQSSIAQNASLKQQIESLSQQNVKLGKEAENLAKALKGDNKMQGNWGEMILLSLLEKSGLAKDREYLVQESVKTEDGKRFQPDVIVQMPDNKQIIIDSKVSLVEYEKYYNSETGIERELHLKNHYTSVKNHINNLTSKEYQKLHAEKTLDFIILFAPIEGSLNLAYHYDNQLFNYAFERNIILASPSNLLAMLRTISNVWKREHQNKNVLEIADKAGKLYDQFVLLLNEFEKMGEQIDRVQKTYSDAKIKFTGKGNLIRKIEDIRKLGANTSKQISERWLSEDDVNEL